MLSRRVTVYLEAPMPNADQRFESLAAEFETLAERMRVCRDPELRLVLLRRMKVLLDEIDALVFTSLSWHKKRIGLIHSKIIPAG